MEEASTRGSDHEAHAGEEREPTKQDGGGGRQGGRRECRIECGIDG
jgi:hypothetical protein